MAKFRNGVYKITAVKMFKDNIIKDESERALQNFAALSSQMLSLVKAHKDLLTELEFLHVNQRHILTAA